MASYNINATKKWIIINDDEKLTKQDKEDIQIYLSADWILKHKSKAKSDQAKTRAKRDTDKSIREAIGEDEEALNEYTRLLKDNGFFAARKYYYEWISNQKAEDKPAEDKPKRTKKAAAEKEQIS